MPKGVYTCQYNGCGKSCMREDGCYRHSEIGRQNKREAMKAYKQSDAYKKRVAEREREKKEALEAEAERRVEEKRKQIIEEYRKSLKRSGIEDKNLTDTKYSPSSPDISGEHVSDDEDSVSDDESHPSSCSTCTSEEEDDDNQREVDKNTVDISDKYNEQETSQIFEKLDLSDEEN